MLPVSGAFFSCGTSSHAMEGLRVNVAVERAHRGELLNVQGAKEKLWDKRSPRARRPAQRGTREIAQVCIVVHDMKKTKSITRARSSPGD